MAVKIDKETCIGCGACTAVCPDMFEIGSDGKAQVRSQSGKCAKEAADGCPVSAIKIG